MNITEKIDKYLNEEGFNIGDYIMQIGSDYVAYGMITKHLKNGSNYAKVYTSYNGSTTGKAVKKSISGWYPGPVKIDPVKIPLKILQKLK